MTAAVCYKPVLTIAYKSQDDNTKYPEGSVCAVDRAKPGRGPYSGRKISR